MWSVNVCVLLRGHTRTRLCDILQNGMVLTGALRQTSFDRGVARELVVELSASDNMAAYRCQAKNEAKKTISAQTRLKVYCEFYRTSQNPNLD